MEADKNNWWWRIGWGAYFIAILMTAFAATGILAGMPFFTLQYLAAGIFWFTLSGALLTSSPRQ